MQKGAIILCGGRSLRMERDKATLTFGPELMLQRVVRLVSEAVPCQQIVVVAAPSQSAPQLPSAVRVARDSYPERGPLQGLEAGLLTIGPSVDAVFVCGCDVPLLEPKLIEYLFDALGSADIAVPQDEFQHALCAVYRSSVLATVQSMLAKNVLKLGELFHRVQTRFIPVSQFKTVDPELRSLWNLNQPEDYERALAAAGFGR